MKKNVFTTINFIIVAVLLISNVCYADKDGQIYYFNFEHNPRNEVSLQNSTSYGTQEFIDTKFGRTLRLGVYNSNGKRHYVYFDSTILNEFTISFWINVEELPENSWYNILGQYDPNWWYVNPPLQKSVNFAIRVYDDGYIGVQFKDSIDTEGTRAFHRLSGNPIETKTWYHVTTVLKTDGTLKLYINGELTGQTTTTETISGRHPFVIGGNSLVDDSEEQMKASLDELRIFDNGNDDQEFINLLYTTVNKLDIGYVLSDEEEIENLETELSDLGESVTTLNTQIKSYKDKASSLENQVNTLNTDLNSAKSAKEAALAKVSELQAEITKMKSENASQTTYTEKNFSERTDGELVSDFFNLLTEFESRKKESRGNQFDGNIEND